MQDPLKTLQTENAELRRALEDSRASFKRFLALAAHDLQGPLRKIVQSGEILHMDAKDVLSEENLYFLNAMNSSAHRLSQLILDLLNYIERSQMPVEREAVDLNSLIKTCVDKCLIEKREENQFEVNDFDVKDLPIVLADKLAMETLFTELLRNSFKFARGDNPLAISVSTRQTARHIMIDIVDNGMGIAPVTHVDVFDPFIRLNEKSAYEGSGLGLSICRLICERHGWTLDYKKNYKPGTFMTVRLPIKDGRFRH